jgi:hypothetical protein
LLPAAVLDAKPGASLFITALGGTREVCLDKRMGDCGMTCAAATHLKRGVLLKRIAKDSLADVAKLYPGAERPAGTRRATLCPCALPVLPEL